MKKTTKIYLIYLFVLLLVILIASINGYETLQSWAFYASGPAVGLVIGAFILERKRVVNLKKFRTDLIVLLSCALIGSFLIAIMLNEDRLKVTYVISLNIVLSIIFLLRNARNFETKKRI
ncbi:hypothetical protein [Winogradskyella sp.]|uniref:hypothetical protein n=1 Tax=Winogradskyella sp. TaxID=1883156 RepID=UPI0026085C7D|nr:hypothetical protein [Winogradskyella sp.]